MAYRFESGHRHQTNMIRTRFSQWEMGSDHLFSLAGSGNPLFETVFQVLGTKAQSTGKHAVLLQKSKRSIPVVILIGTAAGSILYGVFPFVG